MRFRTPPATNAFLAVLVAAAAGIFLPHPGRNTEFLDFKVRMASSGGGRAQLFYDLEGRGFFEANSSRVDLIASPDPIIYYWPLPAGTFHGFRLDPTNNDCPVEIFEAVILAGEGDGEVVRRFDLGEITQIRNIEHIEGDDEALHVRPRVGTTDPGLRIPLSRPMSLPPPQYRWLMPRTGRNAVAVMVACVAAAWFVARLLQRSEPIKRSGIRSTVVPNLFLLGLVAVPAFLRPDATGNPESFAMGNFDFQTRIVAPNGGTAQIFFALGGQGFSEAHSSRVTLEPSPDPVTCRFALPQGSIRALRFDPTDRAAPVVFREPKIVARDGTLVRVFAPDDFVPVNDIESVEATDGAIRVEPLADAVDPILNIRLSSPLVLGQEAETGALLGVIRVGAISVAGMLAVCWMALLIVRWRGRDMAAAEI